jgi:hypothetical protein
MKIADNFKCLSDDIKISTSVVSNSCTQIVWKIDVVDVEKGGL